MSLPPSLRLPTGVRLCEGVTGSGVFPDPNDCAAFLLCARSRGSRVGAKVLFKGGGFVGIEGRAGLEGPGIIAHPTLILPMQLYVFFVGFFLLVLNTFFMVSLFTWG